MQVDSKAHKGDPPFLRYPYLDTYSEQMEGVLNCPNLESEVWVSIKVGALSKNDGLPFGVLLKKAEKGTLEKGTLGLGVVTNP